MCRIFAYSGDINSPLYIEALEKFSSLGENGCVPCGVKAGHLDGWGIHTSSDESDLYYRSIKSISKDVLIEKSKIGLVNFVQTIVHLRKATVGKNMICNTHPFMKSGLSFCHNGSIHAFPETNFTDSRHLREGHTDSETFFMRILGRINGQIGDISLNDLQLVLTQEVNEIKNTSEWTALICILKSSNGLIINYLWNEDHKDVEPLKLKDYYTFYIGKIGNTIIACSEILDIPGFSWEKLKNDTILTIPFI